jgi:hypothetical protein
VDEAGEHFLAGSRFANDQYSAVAAGDASCEIDEPQGGGRAGDGIGV